MWFKLSDDFFRSVKKKNPTGGSHKTAELVKSDHGYQHHRAQQYCAVERNYRTIMSALFFCDGL